MKFSHRFTLALLAVLVVSIPFLANARSRAGGLDNLNPERIDRMAEKLELSSDTTQRIKDLVFEAQKKQIDSKAKAQSAQLELRRRLEQDEPNRAEVMAQIETVSALKTDMKKLHIGLLLDVRGLLSADQRQGLRKFLRRGRKGKNARRKGERGRRNKKGNRRNRRGED